MEKILISKNYYPVTINDNNYSLTDNDGIVRDSYYIENDSEVFIDGKLKYTAKAGDVVIRLYGIENRYANFEYYLIPGSIFGDYFTRLKAEKEARQPKNSIRNVCEKCCCDCEEA